MLLERDLNHGFGDGDCTGNQAFNTAEYEPHVDAACSARRAARGQKIFSCCFVPLIQAVILLLSRTVGSTSGIGEILSIDSAGLFRGPWCQSKKATAWLSGDSGLWRCGQCIKCKWLLTGRWSLVLFGRITQATCEILTRSGSEAALRWFARWGLDADARLSVAWLSPQRPIWLRERRRCTRASERSAQN